MVGDFSNENGLPGTSSDFCRSGTAGICNGVPLERMASRRSGRAAPAPTTCVLPSGMRSLGHGEAEPLTTRKDPSFNAPSWVYRGSVGLVGLIDDETGSEALCRGGSGHCSVFESEESSAEHSGSPIGDGNRRVTAAVERRVARPGRVRRERRRVNEKRWLPTVKCVLDEVAS